jgi:ATP-binding cassette subfamily B protein
MAINSFREDEEMSQTDKGRIIKRLLSHLLHYKLQIVTVLACMLITVVISLVNPLLIETALDKHVANGNIPALLKLAAFAAIINIIFVVLVKIRMYIMARVTNKILLSIRQDLYTHIQSLSFL